MERGDEGDGQRGAGEVGRGREPLIEAAIRELEQSLAN